ncbi:MAG: DUF4013 domain-containing protein [Anaerolineae bacterium]
MIDPERVFSDIFNDQQIIEKSVITVLLSFAVILFPFGLVALAVLLGYQLEIIRNVRDGMTFPLPRWTNFGEKLNRGVGLMIAGAIYNLPNIFIACMASVILSANNGIFALGAVCCCLFPVLLLINIVTVPLQAIGTVRFAETGRVESFFHFGSLFDTIRENSTLLIQWWLWATLAHVVIGGIGSIIPCLGWLAMAALLVPIQGHLMGQLAGRLIDSKPKYQMM